MKRTRLSYLVCLPLTIVALVGCGEKHIHSFSNEWAHDSNYHWNPATCEHTSEKANVGPHVYGDDDVCDLCGYKQETLEPITDGSDVTETEWMRELSGVSPFGLVSNGTIKFIFSTDNIPYQESILEIDLNKIKVVSIDKYEPNSSNPLYFESRTSNFFYKYYLENGAQKYTRTAVDSINGDPYLVKQVFSDLVRKYNNFTFNSESKMYVSKGSVEVYGETFDSFSLLFENKKLSKLFGSLNIRGATFTCEFSVSHDPVSVTLPQNYEDYHDVKIKRYDFWSCFGSAYTSVLDSITQKASENISDEKTEVNIDHLSIGSYDKIKKEMMSACADCTYPSIVTGYPDHFAEYSANDILKPLDSYVENYNIKHDTDLLKDYYSEYMVENYGLDCDDNGNDVLSGLPFCKSTELMGYNGVFVDYCASLSDYASYHLDVVPTTWQEWKTKGVYYREILDGLTGNAKEGTKGLCVYGRQNYEGKASDFAVKAREGDVDASGRKLLLDFTEVDKNATRIISWDSTDNMFITLIKQWGAEYTRLPSEQKQVEPYYRKGDIMFFSAENKPKVIECMKFFNELNKQRIFTVPKELQQSYASSAFQNNQIMFMICSSGGLNYNTTKWENRFRVAPLPYNANLPNYKFVVSQGADITLTDQLADNEKAFDFMVNITTGELNAEWCLQTGYYPVSVSATNTTIYQDFLEEDTAMGIGKYMSETGCTEQEAKEHAYYSPTRVASREGALVNQNVYLNQAKGWIKYVDPAFVSSSVIRSVVKTIFEKVFINLGADPTDSEYEEILASAINDPSIKQRPQNIRVVY